MSYIFYDLNARDPNVSDSTAMMLEDTKVVVQGVWRLLQTESGEIPCNRAYGLDVKQFSQYPLTKETATLIYNYVKDRVKAFEDRAEIIKCDMDADFNNGIIKMTLYLQVKATQDIVALPTWNVQVGSNT